MGACVAYACTSRPSKKIPGITFHMFPKKPDLRAQWILAVRRKDWQPSQHSHLCSKHFTPDQFDRSSQSVVRLKEGSVPCVFEGYPSYFQKKPKAKKTFPRRTPVANNCLLETAQVHETPVANSYVFETAEDLGTYSSCTSSSVTDESSCIDFSTIVKQLDNCGVLQSSLGLVDTAKEQKTENEDLKGKLKKALKWKRHYQEKTEILHQAIGYQNKKMKHLREVLSSLKKERFRSINTSEILNTIIN